MKHKLKVNTVSARVFLFIVRNKNQIFKQFQKNKFRTDLIKIIFGIY